MRTDLAVIIVGAGPAGLSTALHLAQQAPELAERTLILEQAHHPRPKLCGGGVLRGGVETLRALGLDFDKIPSVAVRQARFQFEGAGFLVRGAPLFHVVHRAEFDGWLADAARARGLTLQEGAPVVRVHQSDDGVEVDTSQRTYRVRAVVGADGANGVVWRAVAPDGPARASRALGVTLPADPTTHPAFTQARALFDFSWMPAGVQGYVWQFPSFVDGRAALNLGIYDSRVVGGRPPGSLWAALRQALASWGLSPEEGRLQGHPIRWFDPAGPFSAPHLLLVGDAAGASPLLGEGVSFALEYGEVAAEALADGFARDDFSFADYRDRVLTHPLGRNLRLRKLIAQGIYRLRSRAFIRLLVRGVGPLVGRWLYRTLM